MSYNKAKAEKEWIENKKVEESRLRKLGVSEELIMELRENDWEVFKSDRRFMEHSIEFSSLDLISSNEVYEEIGCVSDLLDSIENMELYKILKTFDDCTLNILIYKMKGYRAHEIASICGLTDKSVYRRLDRVKEKIKIFL